MTKGLSIKERIKQAKDLKSEIITIPEWDNVKIEIRTITAKQRAELFQSAMKDGSFDQQTLQMGQVISCCYDPDTKEKIFTYDDISWLLEKASGPIEKIVNKMVRMSGLTPDAVAGAEKN